jgi:hypothetical protein
VRYDDEDLARPHVVFEALFGSYYRVPAAIAIQDASDRIKPHA